MTGQEIAAYLVGAAALGYLVWRQLRSGRGRTCCGRRVCPAAEELARRFQSGQPGRKGLSRP